MQLSPSRIFIISGVVTGISGVYHVVGRCGDLPFQVGDIFDQLDYPSEPKCSVQLRVLRIEAYQRSLAELGSGMTAKIDVSGEGVHLLRPHAVLVASRSIQMQESASSTQIQSHD